MKRREALQLILATGIAPAFVKADILMPVSEIIVPHGNIFAPSKEFDRHFWKVVEDGVYEDIMEMIKT